MTRKDYIKIACVLRETYQHIKEQEGIPELCSHHSIWTIDKLIVGFCDMLKDDNVNFSAEKFNAYIYGVEENK